MEFVHIVVELHMFQYPLYFLFFVWASKRQIWDDPCGEIV